MLRKPVCFRIYERLEDGSIAALIVFYQEHYPGMLFNPCKNSISIANSAAEDDIKPYTKGTRTTEK